MSAVLLIRQAADFARTVAVLAPAAIADFFDRFEDGDGCDSNHALACCRCCRCTALRCCCCGALRCATRLCSALLTSSGHLPAGTRPPEHMPDCGSHIAGPLSGFLVEATALIYRKRDNGAAGGRADGGCAL